MSNIRLLDCTLRDGGYVNDWEFGYENIVNIFERLVSAKLDIIEVGFLDERRIFNYDRTIMPDCSSINSIFGELDKGDSMIVAMIDFGTCGIRQILPAEDCFLDGIRVIFKKEVMKEAIEFCKQIKSLNYKVFVQAVSITSYSDSEMMTLLEMVNETEPYAFSLVDTYGLLHKNNLMHYYNLSNQHLFPSIGIGYHSHNNFQLAYANCIELLENPPKERMLLVDGTLYGMGKSAGNAPTELLAMHIRELYGKPYQIGQILEAIDTSILEIHRRIPWGYSFKFFIAASNDCHPNYVTYLTDKRTLSIKSVNEILGVITKDRKLLYDQAYIEQLYLEHEQRKDCDDAADLQKLKKAFVNGSILLLGPGNTIETERETIKTYIDTVKPIIIAVNFLPNYKVNYIFVSNARRYLHLSSRISKLDKDIQLISTSNVTKTNGKFDYTLQYSSLLDMEAQFVDNPMIMLIKLLNSCGVGDIALAGFDGYTKARKSDYVNPNMAYAFSKEKALEINNDTIASLKRLGKTIPVKFITPSCYNTY